MRTIEIETSMRLENDEEVAIAAAPMLARAAIFQEVKFDDMYKVNFWREETDFQLSARARGYRLFCCPHAICFNFQITNDRGGVHAVIGFRSEKWVIKNNWKFIVKHEKFIGENFDIGNKRLYISRFALSRFSKLIFYNIVIHHLSRLKRNILGHLRGPS